MKVKDLIEFLEGESPKAKILFEYQGVELTLDEWSIESFGNLITVKLFDKD